MVTPHSDFLNTYVPELLDRFSLSCEQDDTCMEYHLFSKRTRQEVSKNLIISCNTCSRSLYVSKFYPEIYTRLESKFLSAACFYLIVHHAVNTYQLANCCKVNLETDRDVYRDFYAKLKEFDFKILYNRPSDQVSLRGEYHRYSIQRHMISSHCPDH